MDAVTPPEAPKTRRWRTILARVGLVIGGPLVMLTVLELVLRLFGIDPSHGAFDQRVWLRFDLGEVEAEMARDEQTPRLLCLGDSTIHGMPLDGILSMCTIVGESLGTPVVNLSQAGIDSSHVRQLAEVGCKHKNTLVLLYLGHNEFLNMERFVGGRHVPGAVLSMVKALRHLRVYRLFAALPELFHPRSQVDYSWTDAHEDEVYAAFEENVRGILETCQNQRLVMSTTISNPAFRFPLPGRTLRQSFRERGASQAEPTDGVCRHCLRAGPQVNVLLRRLAAEYNRPIVEAEPLVGPDPDTRFWDHVHPKPDLHLAIARQMLGLAKERGWVQRFAEPKWFVPEPVMTRARVERSFDNMLFDPERAVRELGAITTFPDPVLIQVGIGLGGFLTDDRATMARGFGKARELLERDPVVREAWSRCGGYPEGEPEHASGRAPECQLSCMMWCSNRVVNADEQKELEEIATELGGPIVGRVMGRF